MNPDNNNNNNSIEESCPYLDTITRTLLDFDFEPSCSVSLESGPHIYCCLVCGVFFRGKSPSTPAYTHALQSGHAVYMHLTHGTFHCLPDDYVIKDPSLNDIQMAFKPKFTTSEIQLMDQQSSLSRDLLGRRYLPGFVGLNNLNKTDYINATLQALAHVKPLRDFFLQCGDGIPFSVQLSCFGGTKKTNNASKLEKKSQKKRKRDDKVESATLAVSDIKNNTTISQTIDPTLFSPLVKAFGELIRKIWSDKRFKSTVDPHMLVQAISVASNKKFTIGKQAEAGEFMAWLLHQLHSGICAGVTRYVERNENDMDSSSKRGGKVREWNLNKKKDRERMGSIVQDIFQGLVEVTTRRKKIQNDDEINASDMEDDRLGSEDEEDYRAQEAEKERQRNEKRQSNDMIEEVVTNTNFLLLTLDIPEKPLFKDDKGGLVIPQEPLVSVLKKFDGMTFQDVISKDGNSTGRRFRLKKLPNYLILHLARFKRNSFQNEKNPTIVAFPVKNLDLTSYVFHDEPLPPVPTENEVRSMNVKELRELLQSYGRLDLANGIIEKSELIQAAIDFLVKSLPDLLSEKFNLVANITHTIPAEVGREGQHDPLEEGSYRCHVQHKATGQWYEMQDLHVQEIMPQLIGLSESYVLIFEKKGS